MCINIFYVPCPKVVWLGGNVTRDGKVLKTFLLLRARMGTAVTKGKITQRLPIHFLHIKKRKYVNFSLEL